MFWKNHILEDIAKQEGELAKEYQDVIFLSSTPNKIL